MKKGMCIIWLMVFICLVSFAPVWAEEKKPDVKEDVATAPDDKEKAEITEKVNLFYQLVSYGETEKNPLVMMGAIKVFDDLSFSAIAKPGKDEKTTPPYDRVTLLKEAKEYAAGDAQMLAVLGKIETGPETVEVRGRGGPGGPGRGGPGGHGGSGNYYSHGSGNRGYYSGGRGYGHGPRYAHCFIATAAYGSPFAERVETLRRFRDQWLLKSSLGEALVDFYYRHSPALANSISESPGARVVTRTILYPVTVVAGACIGQTKDTALVVFGLGMVMTCVVLLYRRKEQPGKG